MSFVVFCILSTLSPIIYIRESKEQTSTEAERVFTLQDLILDLLTSSSPYFSLEVVIEAELCKGAQLPGSYACGTMLAKR
jgi:hypothetical protein